jgi:hypothetical protein
MVSTVDRSESTAEATSLAGVIWAAIRHRNVFHRAVPLGLAISVFARASEGPSVGVTVYRVSRNGRRGCRLFVVLSSGWTGSRKRRRIAGSGGAISWRGALLAGALCAGRLLLRLEVGDQVSF